MHTINLKIRIPEQEDAETPEMDVTIMSEFTDSLGNARRGKANDYDLLILYDFFKKRFRERLDREYVERAPVLRSK